MSLTTELSSRLRGRLAAINSGESLKAKVFRGGVWLGTGSFFEQLTRFARNILLTRLLAPQAFGLMAIVLSATTFLTALTDIGVRDAIIQNPRGEEDTYIGVAYWLSFGRTLMLSFAMFLLSPWVAKFYGNPELSSLLRVASLSIAIGGAMSPGMLIDMKRLQFKKWAFVNHVGGICGVILTVLFTLVVRDVWALVLGVIAENLARTVLSFIVYPYVPSLRWSRQAYRELVKFSKGLFGLSFLNLIFSRADIFVLGKLVTPAQLGLYTMAVYLVQTPVSFLMNILGQTLLPTFAHIQGDKDYENKILVQITSLLIVLGIPGIVFLFFCGHSLLGILYGPQYSAAAGALIAASCVAVLNLANGQITTIFYARGVPQLHRRSMIIMAVIMAILIYPAVKWMGPTGGQIACLVAVLVGYLFQVERVRGLTGLRMWNYFGVFFVSAAASIIVPIVYLGSRSLMRFTAPVVDIGLGIVGCLLAYLLTASVLLRSSKLGAALTGSL